MINTMNKTPEVNNERDPLSAEHAEAVASAIQAQIEKVEGGLRRCQKLLDLAVEQLRLDLENQVVFTRGYLYALGEVKQKVQGQPGECKGIAELRPEGEAEFYDKGFIRAMLWMNEVIDRVKGDKGNAS